MGKKLNLLIVLLSVFAMACSGTRGFEAAINAANIASKCEGRDQLQNKVNTQSTVLKTPTQKLQTFAKSLKANSRGKKLSISESKVLDKSVRDIKVKKNKKLAVTFDSQCVAEKQRLGQDMSNLISERAKQNPGKSLSVSAVSLSKDWNLNELSAEAESEDCILNVSEDLERQLFNTDDSHLSYQLTMPKIKWTDTLDEYMAILDGLDRDIKVAIIDNGVRTSHSDLADNIWINEGEIAGNGVDDDNNGFIDDFEGWNFHQNHNDPDNYDSGGAAYHGTHVAGLAAGVTNNGRGIAGVMPAKVKIMSINVFSTNGASSSAIANGIYYAVENGADVINMSLGGSGESTVTTNAIAAAINAGVFVVVAAGNGDPSTGQGQNLNGTSTWENIYPAKLGAQFSGMLTVGAAYANDNKMCRFSNYSTSLVEIAAPGCEDYQGQLSGILSTVSNSNRESKYDFMAGTSMASPVMAGAVALVLGSIEARTGERPNNSTLETFLRNHNGTMSAISTKVNGSRFLNLQTLLDGINSEYPETVTPPCEDENNNGVCDNEEEPTDPPIPDPCDENQ